jgi:predicted DNA-binding transcriptional regulator AlpA
MHRASIDYPPQKRDPHEQKLNLSTEGQYQNPPDIGTHAAQDAATREENGDEAQLLTVQEVANKFHVPVSWVYERTRRRGFDQLPHIKLGKYLRFEEAALTEFIRRQRCA